MHSQQKISPKKCFHLMPRCYVSYDIMFWRSKSCFLIQYVLKEIIYNIFRIVLGNVWLFCGFIPNNNNCFVFDGLVIFFIAWTPEMIRTLSRFSFSSTNKVKHCGWITLYAICSTILLRYLAFDVDLWKNL